MSEQIIIVTEGSIPNPANDKLLVVEAFNGTTIPTDRLPIGVYYCQDGTFKRPNWQNLANILAPTLQKLLLSNLPQPPKSEVIVTNLAIGSNAIPHNLNQRPNIIQFWQNDLLLNAGFYTQATSTELIILSPDIYVDVEINLILF